MITLIVTYPRYSPISAKIGGTKISTHTLFVPYTWWDFCRFLLMNSWFALMIFNRLKTYFIRLCTFKIHCIPHYPQVCHDLDRKSYLLDISMTLAKHGLYYIALYISAISTWISIGQKCCFRSYDSRSCLIISEGHYFITIYVPLWSVYRNFVWLFLYARLQTGRIMVWWCPSVRPSVFRTFLIHALTNWAETLLCRLRSIAAHRDHFVRRLSVCACVRLSVR